MNRHNINIDTDFVALVQLLPGFNRTVVYTLFDSLSYPLASYEDLYKYLQICKATLSIPAITMSDFAKAREKVLYAIEANATHQITVLTCFDTRYPQQFHTTPDPPVILYCKGNVDLLNYPLNIGVVGTREPADIALQLEQELATYLAKQGVNIVSGLAKGCDTAAHKGALMASGLTTAFLAHGLQMVHPEENAALAAEILATNGLLVSEYAMSTLPKAGYFVERDRLQAYLSHGLVVIQTDVKGGTMHAVNSILAADKTLAALYSDSEAFRVHPKSQGNLFLIQEKGALPLVRQEDIVTLQSKLVPSGKDIVE